MRLPVKTNTVSIQGSSILFLLRQHLPIWEKVLWVSDLQHFSFSMHMPTRDFQSFSNVSLFLNRFQLIRSFSDFLLGVCVNTSSFSNPVYTWVLVLQEPLTWAQYTKGKALSTGDVEEISDTKIQSSGGLPQPQVGCY